MGYEHSLILRYKILGLRKKKKDLLKFCQRLNYSKIPPLGRGHPSMFFRQSQSPPTKAKHGREPKAKKLASGAEGADIDRLYVPLDIILNISQLCKSARCQNRKHRRAHLLTFRSQATLYHNKYLCFLSIFTYNYWNCHLQLFQVLGKKHKAADFAAYSYFI